MLLTTHTPNDDSKNVVDLVEYHVNMLLQFQDIVEKISEKGHFGVWLSVRMNMGEIPVICVGQYEAILKQYIFTTKMWNNKGKCWIVPKDKGYGIMI